MKSIKIIINIKRIKGWINGEMVSVLLCMTIAVKSFAISRNQYRVRVLTQFIKCRN